MCYKYKYYQNKKNHTIEQFTDDIQSNPKDTMEHLLHNETNQNRPLNTKCIKI